MQSHYITYKNSNVHYLQFGSGPQLIFCFHGYGRESDTFYLLERRIGKAYTIIALDIPYHGRTRWNDGLIFEPDDMKGFMLDIAKGLGVEQDKFMLLGFSMGGRIALYLTQLMPEKVKKLILLAPDGLNYNFWRWLGTHTKGGNSFLHYTINKPGWAIWTLNKVQQLKMLPASAANFVRYYIEDEDHRQMLYRRYISTRRFNPSLRKLKNLIRKYRIPVRMLFGRFDRIIPYKGGEQFRRGIEDFATIDVVDVGHNVLSEAHAAKIVELINA